MRNVEETGMHFYLKIYSFILTLGTISLVGMERQLIGSSQGMSLHEAAAKGEVAKVSELLNSGANINAKNEYMWVPLHRAAINGHESVVRVLICVQKIEINAQDRLGF